MLYGMREGGDFRADDAREAAECKIEPAQLDSCDTQQSPTHRQN
jgi:hypothetical protein